jgi:hypothetical protein
MGSLVCVEYLQISATLASTFWGMGNEVLINRNGQFPGKHFHGGRPPLEGKSYFHGLHRSRGTSVGRSAELLGTRKKHVLSRDKLKSNFA